MGYPTAIQTFTTKQDGVDYPQAAHVNDLQTEVTAIETALLTAVTHPVTFSTTVTLSTPPIVPQPRVRLTNSANHAVASTAFTGLSWDTEVYDSDGMHSTSVNSSRITFAQSTGLYQVGATVEWFPNSSGSVLIQILLNDSTASVITAQAAPALGGNLNHPITAIGLARATSTTDYVTVQAFQNSGSTRSITSASTSAYITTFWAYKVSA